MNYLVIDKYKKHIQIFINGVDVVPRLSLYTLAKMFKAATTIEKLFPSLLIGKDFSIPGW